MTADSMLTIALLAGLAFAPPVLQSAGFSFWTDVLARIMINALAVASLSLIVTQGGLISLGHAAYFGIGGYAAGIAASLGVGNGFVHLGLAVAVSAIFAFVSGLVALRTRGVHFIMVTLAFCQMVYFVMIGLKDFGGDDGLTIDARSAFPGLDMENRWQFYYVTLAVLCSATLVLARIRVSRFGLVLLAAKASERRVMAAGFDPYRYRLLALMIAGVLCSLAGFLNANFNSFIAPDSMAWTRSAEFLFMLILGGAGSICGPLLGAAIFLLFEQVLGSITVYWQFWFGLALLALVLFARGGLGGILFRSRPG